jgi:hypothetical protein
MDNFELWAKNYPMEGTIKKLCEMAYSAGWNAGVDASDSEAWSKRDKWDEGDGYSPTKRDAAEEIGRAIRKLKKA